MLATPSTLSDLHRTLQASLPFGPGYPGRSGFMLSNHLPMTLHALHRLGAPREALARLLAQWTPRLLQVEGASAQTAPDRASAYLQALAALEREAEGLDDQALCGLRLPTLLQSPEAAAFHGVIRVAHALQGGHRGELLRALAAWEASARRRDPPVGPAALPPAGAFDLRAALDEAREDPLLGMTPRANTSIVSDMIVARGLPAFDRHAATFAPSLDALAEASLAVYLATRDFTALHLVTGVHAARVVFESVRLDEATVAVARSRLSRAWLAAWVSIGRPMPAWARVHEGSASENDWAAALPAVFASTDDHVIKLADAAREEWRHRGWPGYAACLPAVAREA